MSMLQGECENPEESLSRVSVTKSDVSATAEDATSPAHVVKDEEESVQMHSAPEPTAPMPEGGFAAWCTVAGAFFVQMCGFGYTTSFGVYQDYYRRVYLTDASSSAISWIGSISAFLVVAVGLLVGRLYDRGYFYHLLYGGSLLSVFSLFMLSLAKPNAYYQVLLSQGVGVGLGAGMIYVPSIAIVSQYFQRHRALAMTIVAAGSSFGAIVHPIMLNNMLNSPSIGFATAARASAGMIAGLLLFSCMVVRTRIPPPKTPVDLRKAARKFAKDAPYVFTVLGISIFIVGFYFPLFYLQLDALTHDLNEKFSFYALVIMNTSSFFGRLAPGFVANKLGVPNIITSATFICSVLILGMIGLKSVASVVVIAVIYGFFAGVYVALLGPYFAILTDDMAELGVRMGVGFFFVGIGSLIGTPIDGALLTGDYIWWRPALFSGIICFIGFSCFVMSMVLLRRRRNGGKVPADVKV